MNYDDRQVKHLLRESNLIEGYNNAQYDVQAWRAWEYLGDVYGPAELTHHHVQKAQQIITRAQDDLRPEWRGQYRKMPVTARGRDIAPWIAIRPMLDEWLQQMPEADPVQHHIQFERIHPFVDGNGRTGRLLMWWHQMRRGEPLTILNHQERDAYFDWFDTGEEGVTL